MDNGAPATHLRLPVRFFWVGVDRCACARLEIYLETSVGFASRPANMHEASSAP
jgi:hypothetical protein